MKQSQPALFPNMKTHFITLIIPAMDGYNIRMSKGEE